MQKKNDFKYWYADKYLAFKTSQHPLIIADKNY